MLIISQNVHKIDFPVPEHAVLRVNVAWVPTVEELYELLEKTKNNDIFLDFPEGRAKPPKPTLTLDDLIPVMEKIPAIKYFAITNTKYPKQINALRGSIPSRVELVPKIESKLGVDNLEKIAAALKAHEKHMMFDHEDLYTDLNNDNEVYLNYRALIREKSKKLGIILLEMQGVIFSPIA